MFRIVREPPDMTALPRTEYSPGLEAIVARALAKPVAERYPDLDEMRDDLERLVRETAARLLAAQKDTSELVTAIARARADGQLQKALTMCRRVLELDPGHAIGQQQCREVEDAIRVQEVEQLSSMALGYAADGDLDLALKIASKVARLAPESARYRDLAAYLDEEAARRSVAALVSTAQEHIVLGNLEEARAAAEKVLAAQPDHAIAREIRDRAGAVIDQRNRQGAAVEGPGLTPEGRAALDARRAEAAAHTAAALDHFLRSDHVRARKAVDKALSLDPENRRAEELRQVLGILG
jgi:tetratricopeptide (TPR) repeat protein